MLSWLCYAGVYGCIVVVTYECLRILKVNVKLSLQNDHLHCSVACIYLFIVFERPKQLGLHAHTHARTLACKLICTDTHACKVF